MFRFDKNDNNGISEILEDKNNSIVKGLISIIIVSLIIGIVIGKSLF